MVEMIKENRFRKTGYTGFGKALVFFFAVASLIFFSGTAFAVNGTAVGTVTARSNGDSSIIVKIPYTDDDDANHTLRVQWKLCSAVDYPAPPSNTADPAHAASPYVVTISGLTANTCYNVRSTFTDSAVTGTNPQTIKIATTWDTTLLHNSNRFLNTTKWTGNWGTGTMAGFSASKFGQITCETCHQPDAPNIKRVKNTLAAPNGTDSFPGQGATTVNFQSVTTPNGFGNDAGGHATSQKICEYCHSANKYHNYNTANNTGGLTHSNNADCTSCHPHSVGFFYSASCDSCHGNPPDDTHLTNYQGKTTGSTTSGKHATHATTLAYACDNCHSNSVMPRESTVKPGFWDISIAFSNFGSTTGTYSGQNNLSYNNVLSTATGADQMKCSTVYCHGGTLDGTNTTPTWTGTAACGSCHKNDAASMASSTLGKHALHAGSGGLGLACIDCHGTNGSGGTGHVTGTVQFDLSGNPSRFGSGAKYNNAASGTIGNRAPSAGYQSCSSVYCHSNVQTANGTGAPNFYDTINWGTGSTTCSSCHADMSGLSGTGSHVKHANSGTGNYGMTCGNCHDGYTSSSTNIALHANATINVDIAANYGGSYSGGTTPGNHAPQGGYGSCSNVYCHSTAQSSTGGALGPGDYKTVSWGAAGPLGCAGCHSNMAVAGGTGSHELHVVTDGYGCEICHGTGYSSTTVVTSTHVNKIINISFTGNAAGTSYGGGTTPGDGYGSCSTGNCHGTSSPTWGNNTATTTCEKCHGSASTAAGGSFKITAGTTNTAASVIHVSHLASSHNYTSDITCDQCHSVPATVGTAGHIDTALPAEVPMNGALARTGGLIPGYDPGTKTCSNMYCHGKSLASNNPTPPSSVVVSPTWTATFLGVPSVVGNGNNTPGSGDCAKCHAYPPMNGPSGTHTGKVATDCTGCHPHVNAAGTGFGDVTKHMNGTVEGGKCDSCHGYEETSWAGATQRAIEGKGAHAKHVAHLVRLARIALSDPLWDLDPNTNVFGSGNSWTYVCGICHSGATHSTGEPVGGTGRQISILTTYQFGSSAPVYNAAAWIGTSSSAHPKTCSSVSCHFTTTPVWSAY